jgi:TonB family protein
MRQPGVLQVLTVSTVVLVARLTLAQAPTPIVEEPSTQYRETMRAMAAILFGPLPGDFGKTADGAKSIKTKLDEIEAFWAAKKVDDAVAFAKTGGEAAAELEAAAQAEDGARAAAALKDLMATCVGCHQKHVQHSIDTGFAVMYPGAAASAPTGTGLGPGVVRSGTTGVTIPQPLSRPGPRYTVQAMRMKVTGAAIVACVVETDGSVSNARIMRSLDPVFGLDDEAIKAARQWRFEPGTRDGEPVRVAVTIEMSFTLR